MPVQTKNFKVNEKIPASLKNQAFWRNPFALKIFIKLYSNSASAIYNPPLQFYQFNGSKSKSWDFFFLLLFSRSSWNTCNLSNYKFIPNGIIILNGPCILDKFGIWASNCFIFKGCFFSSILFHIMRRKLHNPLRGQVN